ncbi:Fanconi anemia group C protein-like [Patiria miniata]|uniref:Uncharacterized protein n=1 Tax=Patiria miniata TaxID=46514 RepID=A0A913ZF65_PATMI|nr:Fanconi anemia group C protein-like [Patiria miniata]
MDGQTVKQWLDRVTEWKESGKGEDSRPDDVDIVQLRSFLRELHEQLVKWGRPTLAMRNLPNVAQLLGHLCCNEVLKIQETDYQLVMQCVMALYVAQPNEPLEEKASKWAQSQVRHSVSYYKERNPCRGVADSIGCSSSGFNQTASLKLLESMVEDLNKIPTTRWNSSANCLVPCAQLSSNTLRDLSELCLPLVTSDKDVLPLVETLLSCHRNSTAEALSPAFLEAVTNNQCYFFLFRTALELSYEGRVSLWTRYLPALEREFLHLVQALVPLLPSSELRAKELMQSRDLPRACVENPSLLSGVETLMELLLQHTKGSAFTLSLMGLFRRCVRESRGTIPPSHQCLNRRPASDSLRNLLEADPQELPTNLLVLHINNLSNCLTQQATNPAGSLRAWLLLVSSQAWYRAVLKTTLLGPANTTPACLNVLAWYNLPLAPDRHQEYKDHLSDVITSVQGLCSKTVLQPQDLQYAFSSFRDQRHGSPLRNVFRPLLMLFVVYGNVTHHILQDIVGKAIGENQPSCLAKFTFLLDSIEFALSKDGSHSQKEHTQQPSGYQRRSATHALLLCGVCAEYQRERSVGAVRLPEDLHQNLMGRYNRIQKLAEIM